MAGGHGRQEVIKLRRDATIFGREKGDVVVNDIECSSTHCQVIEINGVYHIFDMNSTNGTYVNNQRIIKSKLAHEDIITMGSTRFRFALEDESQLRHITTTYQAKNSSDTRNSVMDSLIETELSNSLSTAVIELNVTYKNNVKESFSLAQRIIYLGRASSFGQFDKDAEVSRKHVMIKLNDSGEIFIEDQGSSNGTLLNGHKIQGLHQVDKNDLVQIGHTKIRIKVRSAA